MSFATIYNREVNMEVMISAIENGYASILGQSFKKELLRKALHVLIILVPFLAAVSLPMTVALLSLGILFYMFCEMVRKKGGRIPVLSYLTEQAARKRDEGHFVRGPVTLGLGALITLVIFPAFPAALGIMALGLGDAVSSLAGKFLGEKRIPFSGGKSYVGSLACFFIVLSAASFMNCSLPCSFVIAATATFLEVLPLENGDNILIPTGTAMVAFLIL